MKSWVQMLICAAIGVAAFFAEPRLLLDMRAELLTFLSVLLGAVLFRLGRGFPQLALDQMDVQQVSRVADAFKIVAGRLLGVFAVTGTTVLFLVLTEPILALVDRWPSIQRIVTCTTSMLVAFAVVRAVAVVLGDKVLLDMQADLVKRDAAKRHARTAAAELDRAGQEAPFTTPKDYGGLRPP